MATSSEMRATVSSWLQKNVYGLPDMHPETEGELKDFVIQLFKESKQWRQSCLGDWRYESTDPYTLWKDARMLEAGKHWKVYGRRNLSAGDSWKHELVDNEIGNTIRVRKLMMSSGWHDFLVQPDINHINEILAQERLDAGWYDFLLNFLFRGLTEGTAVAKLAVDNDDYPDGLVMAEVLDNESLFFSPFTRKLKKRDNNWYLIQADLWTMERALRKHPRLRRGQMTEASQELLRNATGDESEKRQFTYAHTRLVDRFEMWWDDDSTERTPFDPRNVMAEHQMMIAGQIPEAHWTDDHEKHMEAHDEFLKGVESQPPPQNPEAARARRAAQQAGLTHMQYHLQMANRHVNILGYPLGRTPKYPNGRRTIIIGGQVADDGPSPFSIPWRRLYKTWYVEKLPGSFYGRGVAEILYHSNKTMDTMLSRFADISLAVGIPKPYFQIAEKEEIEKAPLDNDPTTPGWYVKQPPEWRRGESTPEMLDLYGRVKQASQREQGVNDVSYGEMPSANASGRVVDLLSRANRLLTTGEANTRLSQVLSELVVDELALMKQFYVIPRAYVIDGVERRLVVREVLSHQVVTQEGKLITKPIEKLRVTVKPDSNFPNQWEYDITFLTQLLGLQFIDPVVRQQLSLLLVDRIGERYPDLAPGGKYFELSQVIQLGLQALQRAQARAMQEQQLMKKAENKIQTMGLTHMLKGGTNVGT